MYQRSKRVLVRVCSVGYGENRLGMMCWTPSISGFIRCEEIGVFELAQTVEADYIKRIGAHHFQLLHNRCSVYQYEWSYLPALSAVARAIQIRRQENVLGRGGIVLSFQIFFENDVSLW